MSHALKNVLGNDSCAQEPRRRGRADRRRRRPERPEAITAVFPLATVQTWIVHLLRQSLYFAPGETASRLPRALKEIYRAVDADAG
jgi:hypothetical protein